MSTPLKQKLTKSSLSSSPNRFQVLSPQPTSPSSPSPSSRPPSNYLQIATPSPKSPSAPVSIQDFPPLPRNLTQLNPSPSSRFQILPPQSPSSSQSPRKTQYFSKFKKKPIIILEPEFHNLNNPTPNFQEISSKVFHGDFFFISEDFLKNRKYYEHILVDTNSVEIEHNLDPKDTSRINYSKIRILRVLSPSEFSSDLYTTESFSNPSSSLLRYCYLDYKKAWFNAFFVRPFNHSWFIYWCKNIPTPLPQWFYHWWSYFGLSRDVLPTPVIQGFEYYKKNYALDSSPSLLSFSMQFSIPWILAWTFQVEEIDHIKWLSREFNIKWWANFKTENADISAVRRWINSIPKIPASTFSEDFKTRKQRLQMALANASTEEEFQKIVTELQSFNSEPNTDKEDSINSDNQDDQDDFFSQYH